MYQEEWKDIPGWEGIYQISNFGRIKRLKGWRAKEEKIYLGKDAGNGYLRFVLKQKNKKERWDVHRLVATVFQRPLLKDEEAHHKNKFKFCNCKWNIEIKDGDKHAEEHGEEKRGKPSPFKGKKHTEEDLQKMRQAHLGKPAWNRGKKLGSQWRAKDPATGRFVKIINT